MSADIVSHYRLLNHLGEGGMGVVHRAEDLQLGREVAVKVLRTEALGSREWLGRFEREARLASALQHPHICTIHELGEHNGHPFIVMELLEGRTIRQLVEEGPLPIGRLLEFTRQVAEALDAAHRRGIVHRDIKPANLFVTHGDRLKVLDFGLAKLAEEEPASVAETGATMTKTASMPAGEADLTRTGSTVGTAAYMSPEQATGQPVDARTDLFSLGTVLYEMATGRRAFGGDDIPMIVMKIINGIVIPPRTINEHIPERVEAIILKLMAVDPRQRYQTATDLLTDLQTVTQELDQAPAGRSGPIAAGADSQPRRLPPRWALATAAAAVLLAGIAGTVWMAGRTPALTDRDSLLIGSFENTTGDSVFDETLSTALKVHLGQSPFLDIIPDQRIRETLASMNRPTDQRLTHDIAREVCQRLGVKAMLEGSVAALGSHFVVMLHATDCESGASIARAQAEATTKERVLTELGRISSSMRSTLGESLPSMQKFDVPIEQATTPSLPALKAYTLGVEERSRGRELESIAFFNQAIEHDREFAAAYTMLSTVYGGLGEPARSEEYARLAYGVPRKVSERERLFVTYQYHDRVTGSQDLVIETLEVWKAAYPRDMQPPNALAVVYNRMGRYEQAVAEAQEALRRRPGHPFPLSNLAFAYRSLGKYDEARRTAAEAVRLGVETSPTRRLLYQLAIATGDGTEGAHLAWAKNRPREFDLVSAQGQAAAYAGRMREATDFYQRAADIAMARGLAGAASGFIAHLAWTEALYLKPADATGHVTRTLGRIETRTDAPGTVPRYRASAALGLAGLTAEARSLIAPAQRRYPDSTFVRTVTVPATVAAIALRQSKPDDAISALEAATPTETGTVAGLIPFYLRAEAWMQKGEFAKAIEQYDLILRHRGVDPLAPVVPLAYLGLARARARSGDVEGSRRAYEELFAIWKHADADFPPLASARAEFGAMTLSDPQ